MLSHRIGYRESTGRACENKGVWSRDLHAGAGLPRAQGAEGLRRGSGNEEVRVWASP